MKLFLGAWKSLLAFSFPNPLLFLLPSSCLSFFSFFSFYSLSPRLSFLSVTSDYCLPLPLFHPPTPLQEWVISKQVLTEKEDIVAEELERKKWGEWAMHASEKERYSIPDNLSSPHILHICSQSIFSFRITSLYSQSTFSLHCPCVRQSGPRRNHHPDIK